MCVLNKRLQVLLCGTLVLAACTIPRVPAKGSGPPETFTVEVDNRELLDLRIFLVRDGTQLLLGFVEGMTQRKLIVQAAYGATTTPFALAAITLSGSETLRSPIVTVERGQVVSWRIERASRGTVIMIR